MRNTTWCVQTSLLTTKMQSVTIFEKTRLDQGFGFQMVLVPKVLSQWYFITGTREEQRRRLNLVAGGFLKTCGAGGMYIIEEVL